MLICWALDQEQEIKKMRQELLQANKKIAQLKQKQSEDTNLHRNVSQSTSDGADYEDDENSIESEDEPEASSTPVSYSL